MKKKFHFFDSKALANLTIVLVGILFYVALSNLGALREKVSGFLGILSPFIIGFAVAYLLNTPTAFFERKVYKNLRWKRGLSILTVYLLVFALLVVLIALVVPQVIDSIVALVNNMGTYLNNLNTWVTELTEDWELEWEGLDNLLLSYQDLWSSLASTVSSVLPQVLNYGIAVGSGIISAITAVISSVYMLSGKKALKKQVKALLFALFPADKTEHVLHICRRSNQIFIGFINGKIIDSVIIGVLCAILCVILRIPYVPLLSVVIGVTNIIPFFGPFIGAIPSVLILLMVNPWAAVRFGIMILALQQLDGNLIGPKILGNYTGLSAIWVLVAIVVGGGLFGVAGMILGVPVFAVIYMLMRDFVAQRLEKKNIDPEGCPLKPAEPPQENE
ncbi:MAG: AI-2E family transporter [Oscillospiraceae bacterium]|nr:AI-2E family transporter [Oscillospiraceae bacterium]